MLVAYVLDRLYSLELRLAGFNNKGMKIDWGTSTVSDEVKIQQGLQYKIQNLDLLYKAGIISQEQYAWAMGYDSPDEDEPRVSLEDQFAKGGNSDPQEGTKKNKGRMIKINLLVGQEIKQTRLLLEETKILKQDEIHKEKQRAS